MPKNSREFLEEMIVETKKYVPGWLYASLVQAARPRAGGRAKAKRAQLEKAVWTTQFINDLPDSSFLYIESGGEKDEEGKTQPRDLRHFPYRDMDGSIDLPHLRNAIARIPQSTAPGLDKDKLQERARSLLERAREEVSKCAIAYVVECANKVEKARQELLVGDTGVVFKEVYLDPLQLTREDVCITTLEDDNLSEINPKLVIALGKRASNLLGGLAQFTLPHPEAIKKSKSFGEINRKNKAISKFLVDGIQEEDYYNVRYRRLRIKPSDETETAKNQVQIAKADSVKRIIYGVVMDPYGENGAQEDAHNDWIPPSEIEKAAHDFMKESRVIGLQHNKATTAKVVESFLWPYPNGTKEYHKALNGESHKVYKQQFGNDVIHSGSWILGVELPEKEWEMFEKGEINAFSPGGFGQRTEMDYTEMPQVEFIELVENNA